MTGGHRGIGAMVTRDLLSAGFNVILGRVLMVSPFSFIIGPFLYQAVEYAFLLLFVFVFVKYVVGDGDNGEQVTKLCKGSFYFCLILSICIIIDLFVQRIME